MSSAGKKVVVAMSGGVDSSVAAALLQRQGYEVMGAFMRLGSPDGVEHAEDIACDTTQHSELSTQHSGGNPPIPAKQKQGCCSVLDSADARRVAGMLDVPFYVLNFQDDFGRVINYFVDEYNRGRTPNPCVRCNDWLKFGKLASYAEAVGADYVASGHYARIENGRLMRGVDHRKDQSYVLFGISPQAIAHTLLPIGGMEKTEVRRIAEELKLPVFNKPDSQEICFVPNQDYAGLVQRRSPETFRKGDLVSTTGEVLGQHDGHQHFTIGQRRGLGVALGHKIYVVDIDASTSRVTVGEKEALFKRSLVATQINLLDPTLRDGHARPCQAKIRYNHDPQPATVLVTGDDEITVRFTEPQTAVTPGQAVVLYDNDYVLGGGWIDSAE